MKQVNVLLILFFFIYPNYATAKGCKGEVDCNTGSAWYIDQDLLGADFALKKNDDRDYTMGLEYAFFGKRSLHIFGYSQLHYALAAIEQKLSLAPPQPGPALITHAATAGDTGFTPNDIGEKKPIPEDRPYANLLYISVANTHFIPDDGIALTNKLVLGALGLDVGKGLQTTIHRWTAGKKPGGWDNQISEGGELTALFDHKRHHLISANEDKGWRKPETSWYWNASVGYYTEVGVGAQLRLGDLGSPFYTHISDPLATANQAHDSSTDSYFFAGVGARYILYNSLLQGQFRHSAVTVSGSDLKRLVSHASLGYTHQFKKFKLTYALHYRSSQMDTALGDREHIFGGFYFTLKP